MKGFFGNAQELLQPDGEIHISDKAGYPYDAWNIEQLAWDSSLTLIDKVSFRKQDYPGYHPKRGAGAMPNRRFCLGDCYTFKFRVKPNEVQDYCTRAACFDYVNRGEATSGVVNWGLLTY